MTLTALNEGGYETSMLPLASLKPWHDNPRRHIDDEDAKALGDAILLQGQLQNLIARPRGANEYEVIVGNRRLRGMFLKLAAGEVSDTFEMRCVVADLSDDAAAAIAIAENMLRRSMNPIEECDALANIVKSHPDINALARSIGLKAPEVTERIAVSKLEPDVKELISSGKRRIEWGRAMTRAGATLRKEIMQSIEKSDSAFVSVQQIATLVRQKNIPTKNALFDVERLGLHVQTDLIEEGASYILDKDAFWTAQNAAIKVEESTLERAGHDKVIVLRGEPFKEWEYEVSETTKGTTAVIEVAPDGLVTIHTNLVRRGSAPANDDTPTTGGDSIFEADASQVPEASDVTITTQPPSSKGADYLAEMRMLVAADMVARDHHVAQALILSGLLGNRDIGLDWPIYLRNGPDLERYNILLERAGDDTFAYALSLSKQEQADSIALCASVRLRHQIGRKVAFPTDSPVSLVMTNSRGHGFNLRDNWTPDQEFLDLLSISELRNLGSGLIAQSQKRTVAASAMAEKKTVGHRS
jgi:ParB family chromosome partitioning protein